MVYPPREKLENPPVTPARADRDGVSADVGRLQRELRQTRRHLSVLQTVADIVSEAHDLDTVLDGVIREITEVFDFEATRIYLYNGSKDRFVLRASFSVCPQVWSRVKSFKPGQGNVGRVAATGNPVVFEDIQSDPGYASQSRTKKSRGGGYRFFGAFPLKSKHATVGAVVCVSSRPQRLEPGEVQLLTAVANQIGVAFEHVRLVDSARAQANEISALYSISTIINESLDLDRVLTKVMRRVMEIFGASAARIYLIDESEGALRLAIRDGLPPDLALPERYASGEGVTGKVFQSGRPLFFGDTLNSRKLARMSGLRFGLKERYRRQFYIPINVKSRTVGVMNFLAKAPSAFTPVEMQLIRTIANHLGIAFENLSLFKKFAQQSEELTSLVQINRDIASLLERDALLPRIVQEARRVLRVDIAHCRLLEGDELVLAAQSHPVLSRLKPRLKLGESLSGIVASEKRVLALRNSSLHPCMIAAHGQLTREMGWRAYLGIPMVIGNRVIGMLCFASTQERDFSPQELHVIESFADQAAIAVENANLFGEIKDKVAALESLNNALHEANRIKSDFVASVSHELRTPLSAIIGYTSLLQDGYGGAVNKTQQEVLETIRHNADALLKLINNVLTLARAEAKKIPVEVTTAPLQETLHHVRMYTEHLDRRKDVEVLWEVEKNLPPIATDHGKLEEILQNLISNAYKFTPQGHIAISVRNLEKDKRIDISVSDTGIGIEEDTLDKVFDKFQQGPNAHTGAHGGMGLGLSIVKEFLDLLHGTMHVESAPGKGSTFSFTIPYAIRP